MDPVSGYYFTNDMLYHKRSGLYPPLNVFDTPDSFIITAEIPGVTADHLDISIERETLCLAGNRILHQDEKDLACHRREISSGTFHRTIVLPEKIDCENNSASLKNGILTIMLNKAVKVKPRRITIAILD